MEDQPKKLDPKDITFSANPKPLGKPDKPSFNGIAIGGVFMSPMTAERQESIDQKLKQISQGKY